jgi:hypothetical protein
VRGTVGVEQEREGQWYVGGAVEGVDMQEREWRGSESVEGVE